MELTSRERLLRIFRNEEVDRPALKLWGLEPGAPQLHPAYEPVTRRALALTDIMTGAGAPFDVYFGRHRRDCVRTEYRDTADPLWRECHSTYLTPKGELHGVTRESTIGDPGYTVEYPLKDARDIEALLSVPYESYPFDASAFVRADAAVGTRGVVNFSIDHAAYAFQRLCGSENFALFSVDCRELVDAAIGTFHARILAQVKDALAHGIRAPFAWVGPELVIPPLASPRDFDDFVYRYDKALCDEIHGAGTHVWVHCHGKVSGLIGRFVSMGVDVLNPLEPPKNGDVELSALVGQYGNRLGWEGNIEIQELLQGTPQRVRELIDACVSAGAPSGRFILCPSAGYMEYARPEPRYIENLLVYIEHGMAAVRAHGK